MARETSIRRGTKPVPKNYNRYLGEAYGNIMDQYDSTTYNLRLYMRRFDNDDPTDSGTSSILPDGDDGSELIVIAQDGVTRNQIRNLELQTVGGLHTPTSVSFDVFQPNRADLLDQMLIARERLGLQGKIPMVYLEINFYGRTVDLDDNEAEGELVRITDPYTFELVIANIEAQLTEDGGTFQFECVARNSEAFSTNNFRLRESVTIRGTTITEMTDSLVVELNKLADDSAYQYPDTFSIDLSQLISDAAVNSRESAVIELSDLIQNEALLVPGIDEVDVKNVPQFDSKLNRELAQSAYDYIRDRVDEVPKQNELRLKAGITIQEVMLIILSMNREFLASLTRGDLDPGALIKPEDRLNAFVKWVKMNARVNYGKFDEVKNDYARHITFIPYFFKTAKTNVYSNPRENQKLSPEEVQSRLDQLASSGVVLKAYDYLFTGVNDQIISMDVSYNNAITVLVATGKGHEGSMQVATGPATADTVPSQAAVDRDSQVAQINAPSATSVAAAQGESTFDFLESIRNGLADLGDLSDAASRLTGLSPEQAADIILAGTEFDRRALSALIDPRGDFLRTGEITTQGVDTSPLGYNPNPIEAVQGADSNTTVKIVTVDEVFSQETTTRTPSQLAASSKLSNATRAEPLVNKATDATAESRKNTNMVFGQLINQHEQNRFLLQADISLRGDPWYLGRDPRYAQGSTQVTNNTDTLELRSQPEFGYFGKDEQYFILTIASPRGTDENPEDEDFNTGYWQESTVNYAFTGVYMLTQAVHRFNQGVYTTDIQGARVTELDIAGLPPKPFPDTSLNP